MQPKISLLILNVHNSQVGIRIRNCASENLCEKIARDPDNSGIHTDCENSERGNDQSLKVCSVNYIYVSSKLKTGHLLSNSVPILSFYF